MLHTPLTRKPGHPSRSEAAPAAQRLKVMFFSIGDLFLALPIGSVYKVLKQTAIYGSGLYGVGLAHLDDRELTVVDLHRQILHTHAPIQGGYIIVAQTPQGDLYGIPIEKVPSLLDIPAATLRPLPESYRCADTLNIASHVAVVPQETGEPLTLFFPEVERLRPAAAAESSLMPLPHE